MRKNVDDVLITSGQFLSFVMNAGRTYTQYLKADAFYKGWIVRQSADRGSLLRLIGEIENQQGETA